MKNKGFTLIEILISTVIIFLTITLIYLIYFNIEKNTISLNNKMKETQIELNFFNSFKEKLKKAVNEKESFELTTDDISFEAVSDYSPYLFKYRYYKFETEKGITLVEKRENLLTGTVILFPVFTGLHDLKFEFFDGELWTDRWDKDNLPEGLRIQISKAENEKFYFYVKIPGKKKNEEKK